MPLDHQSFLAQSFLRPEVLGLRSSKILEVFELGMQQSDFVPLYVGEGDKPTPDFICQAAIEALRAGETFYTHKRGLPELREAIAAYMTRHLKTEAQAGRLCLTASGMHAVLLAMQALIGPGDKVAVLCPIWPNIMAAVQVAGGEVLPIPLDSTAEGGFQLDLNRLDQQLAGAKALFIASPGNPTGWVMSRDEQAAVLEICRRKGIWIIADEVYHRFVFNQPDGETAAPSFLAIAEPDDRILAIHSFSKGWAMTGWRQGWIYYPEPLDQAISTLMEFSVSGTQAFLQKGCLAAITQGEDYVAETVARSRANAELVYEALSACPRVRMGRPQGAFYAFFQVDGMEDSLDFAKRAILERGVGLAPGSAFGPGGEGHLRLCFASDQAILEKGLERLAPLLT